MHCVRQRGVFRTFLSTPRWHSTESFISRNSTKMKLLAYLQKPVNQEHDGGSIHDIKKPKKMWWHCLLHSLDSYAWPRRYSPAQRGSRRGSSYPAHSCNQSESRTHLSQPIRVMNTFRSTNQIHEHISVNWTKFCANSCNQLQSGAHSSNQSESWAHSSNQSESGAYSCNHSSQECITATNHSHECIPETNQSQEHIPTTNQSTESHEHILVHQSELWAHCSNQSEL